MSLYGYRWQKARLRFLKEHPLCKGACAEVGKVTPADVVDHIKPHRGDEDLFWDETNWQPMCKRCHDSHKHRLETSGKRVGCDQAGCPIDPKHHWNKPRGGGKV